MLPPIADDEAIVRASERRVRGILRGQYRGFDSDDLLQEGRLAILLARSAGRVPNDPEHARRYLARRAQGAMLDAGRAVRRQIPDNAAEYEPQLDSRCASDAPDAPLIARDVIRRLRGRGSSRMCEAIEMLARDITPSEVALALSVSVSRISQLRAMARRTLGVVV